MCGIFGIIIGEDLNLPVPKLLDAVNYMFKLSESRGKEASGLAVRVNQSIYVLKEPISASKLVRSKKYKDLLANRLKKEAYRNGILKAPFALMGHSRLQTNGPSEINSNNQPVIKDGAVGIHNGIIVNDRKLWQSFPWMEKKYDVDTEVFLGLLQSYRKQGDPIEKAARKVFKQIEGSASVALLFEDSNAILLATNTGSLYICPSMNSKILVFASEKYILQKIIDLKYLRKIFNPESIVQVKARQGYLIDNATMDKHKFNLEIEVVDKLPTILQVNIGLKIVELSDLNNQPTENNSQYQLKEDTKQSMTLTWESLYSDSHALKRCTRCLLPETMPFINFDDKGVCNYCREYNVRGSFLKGEKALEEIVSKYRKASGEPDCIVGFSGGRDSAYGLNYLVNHLGMHPITFTYDWGMVNDLARRNQARVVGNLGIEHIVISADIKRKRENIRRNLKAWLKKPDLGMVPILMAGDKQFYYYFHKVRKQTGVKLFVFCGGYEGEEGTGLFKYGFCNVNQGKKEALSRLTGISSANKLKIMLYYLGQYIRNPAYVNTSLLDTLFAYYSTYVLQDDYIYLYHYLDWGEKEVLSTIINRFNWEKETDTIATWRIDDGTAAFYNYIYMTIAGFTEFDIFRSHQIREGKLTREEAYEIVKQENRPRFKSIEWYGQAIGFDMNEAVAVINRSPKFYNLKKSARTLNEKLNILIVPCTEWLEGSQQRLHHFAKKWSLHNNIHVIYMERPQKHGSIEKRKLTNPNQTIHKIPTVKTRTLGSFYFLNSIFHFFSILYLILKNKIDVIVAEGLGASTIAIIVAKITNRPIVYDYSDYFPDFIPLYTSKGILRSFFKNLGHLTNALNIKTSNAVVAVSDLLKHHAQMYNDNVLKISNGVSSSFANPYVSDKQIHNEITLCFVGTLESWVSLETVIDALYELNYKESINTLLLIIGDGPKLKSLITYAKRRNISDRVKFLGWIPYNDLGRYLQTVDICVLPFDKSDISYYSMPMKIHEYSLSKKPTISTPLPEIIKLYGESVLYAETIDDYVSSIKLIVEDEKRRSSMMRNAYQIACKNSWIQLAGKYEKILLSQKRIKLRLP